MAALLWTVSILPPAQEHIFPYLEEWRFWYQPPLWTLVNSSSHELRAQGNGAGVHKQRTQGFWASQTTLQQGLPTSLSEVLLFPFMPLEIPEKVELAESYLCLTGLLWRTVIHFNIETRKQAFSSKNFCSYCLLNFEIKLVENWNVFLSCVSLHFHAYPNKRLKPARSK